jgi:hypothetical protein
MGLAEEPEDHQDQKKGCLLDKVPQYHDMAKGSCQ